jgi:sterol desaturase/sphingolipid hydroxylase (fatty acid hydroxylase superfamily)
MFALGLLVWTFAEYTLHRFVFHFHPNEKSELQKDISFIIHGVHHDYPWDADRLVMPPTVGLLLGAGIWAFVHVFCGVYTWACFTGVVFGYVWYDLTHYYVHHGRPKSRWAKWVRRNHLIHHFSTAHERYGITTPLWDVVFGTYPKHREEQRTGQEDAAA